MTQPEPITWTVHLAARRPWQAVAVLLVIVFALFGVAAISRHPLAVIIAAIFLLASIADFLLPVTYTLDADGAHVRQLLSRRTLAWQRVRRVYLSPDGIQLSPLVTRSWVESYRGVLLRTPDRAATWNRVRAWLDTAGIAPEIDEEP